MGILTFTGFVNSTVNVYCGFTFVGAAGSANVVVLATPPMVDNCWRVAWGPLPCWYQIVTGRELVAVGTEVVVVVGAEVAALVSVVSCA